MVYLLLQLSLRGQLRFEVGLHDFILPSIHVDKQARILGLVHLEQGVYLSLVNLHFEVFDLIHQLVYVYHPIVALQRHQ